MIAYIYFAGFAGFAGFAALSAMLAWRNLHLRKALLAAESLLPDAQLAARLEADLKLACVRAENATNAKTVFLANMSHELRTPMNGMIGFTELLLQSDLDRVQRGQTQMIADSGRAMLRLLNDILDVARIEAGQVKLVTEATDLRQKLRHCVDLLEPIARQKGITMSLQVDDALPQYIELDRLRIRQVALNLIGNAVKFTDHGTIDVSARLVRSTSGDHVLIAVTDTGIGIAPDLQESIFTPFTQEEKRLSRPTGGTGLGLTISNQLVKMMSGEISVQSRPGQGSTFTVRLPLRAIELPADHTCAQVPSPSGAVPSSLASCRVLVAEDHDINQQLIMAMLEQLGLEAALASDGLQAIREVVAADKAGRPFHVVLMDMQMPRLDGLEATVRLRQMGYSAQRLPIIALTANCYPDEVAACRHAGMQAHLGKPVTLARLSHELSELMRAQMAGPPDAVHDPREVMDRAETPSGAIFNLEKKYQLRKTALLQQINQCLENEGEGADWDSMIHELHRLAGVAANFGDTQLGEASRRLEQQLAATPQPALRHELLAREWPAMRATS